MANNIVISYNLNDKDYTINFDPNQRASVLKYKICKEEGMQSESLEFYYKDYPITTKDDRPVKEIFGVDPKPKILVLAIGITPKQKRAQDKLKAERLKKQKEAAESLGGSKSGGDGENSQLVNEEEHNDDLNDSNACDQLLSKNNSSAIIKGLSPKKKNKVSIFKEEDEKQNLDFIKPRKTERPNRITEKDIKKFQPKTNQVLATVLVENFPSRQELYDLVEDFFDEYGLERDFKANNKGKSVELLFKDINVAYKFIQYFNLEKLRNPLYAKSVANLLLETKCDNTFKMNKLEHDSLRKNPVNNLISGSLYKESLLNVLDERLRNLNKPKVKTNKDLSRKSSQRRLSKTGSKRDSNDKDIEKLTSNKSLKLLQSMNTNPDQGKDGEKTAQSNTEGNNSLIGGEGENKYERKGSQLSSLDNKLERKPSQLLSSKKELQTILPNSLKSKIKVIQSNEQTGTKSQLKNNPPVNTKSKEDYLKYANTKSGVYKEEEHMFINYSVPYFSQELLRKKLDATYKYGKPKYLHDNTEFIPYAANRRMMDKNSLTRNLYDNPYQVDHISLEEEKKKWITRKDFFKAIKTKYKAF